MIQPFVQASREGVVLTVHVQPKASRTESAGMYGDALKIRVAAPPVGGAANEELIRFLAGEFAVPVSAVDIEKGSAGRRKLVRLRGVTIERVMAWLAQNGTVKR